MRSYVIAGNWKLNAGGGDGCELATKVAEATKGIKNAKIVVSPPFTALAAVSSDLANSHVEVAGQNLYPEDKGAFTGEVSAPMLLAAGAKWVILGHSERRQYFAETDEFVRKKTVAALKAGLRPIVCIGETLAEREANKTLEVVFRQLDAVSGELRSRPGFGVIAYEPVWAIGTGKVATTEQAQEVHAAIRKRLNDLSPELATETAILYGGSVKADNAAALLGCEDIDGALVGGASLDADGFAKIARAVPA
ncbi:MAG TPA: triose-phosphate isomerase [Polyangiaceae bacterium]|jgi:triosephosphate isomerase|nr:triose-phosphate isomerase [Polyangiaceae bacterium]